MQFAVSRNWRTLARVTGMPANRCGALFLTVCLLTYLFLCPLLVTGNTFLGNCLPSGLIDGLPPRGVPQVVGSGIAGCSLPPVYRFTTQGAQQVSLLSSRGDRSCWTNAHSCGIGVNSSIASRSRTGSLSSVCHPVEPSRFGGLLNSDAKVEYGRGYRRIYSKNGSPRIGPTDTNRQQLEMGKGPISCGATTLEPYPDIPCMGLSGTETRSIQMTALRPNGTLVLTKLVPWSWQDQHLVEYAWDRSSLMMLHATGSAHYTGRSLNSPRLVSRSRRRQFLPDYRRRPANSRGRRWAQRHSRDFRLTSPVEPTPVSVRDNALALLDSSRTIRMDKRPVSAEEIHRAKYPTNSLASNSFYPSGSGDSHVRNETDEAQFPILGFQYVEPHVIELLVVVTDTMGKYYGSELFEYLSSVMATVSSLLRHPSLKVSIELNVVDIIFLDRAYAASNNLEDWSHSTQEQVMARFCRWINRQRTPTFTWDSAILLNIGHFKSTALGVAHFRSMCNVESSCLTVLDRGFGTGYIIAHELGHQLGAKHDFELDSDCGMEEQLSNYAASSTIYSTHPGFDRDYFPDHDLGGVGTIRRDTLMSGTLHFDHFPFRWSACSRAAIHKVLQSGAVSCLQRQDADEVRLTASDLVRQLHSTLPGSTFTLDRQCQFVLKRNSTQFCGHSQPTCRQLYCIDPKTGACLPMESTWAEGTLCGDQMGCLYGKCVTMAERISVINGNWGEWQPWSTCSRSCGGGVRFSERECNNPEPQSGGDYCQGARVRMRSCNVKPCEERIDIRQHLCDQIGRQYGVPLAAYLPKLGEASACSLTCLNNGRAVQHSVNPPDGTQCFPQRNNICIKGKCWETGCDGILGSTQSFDRCRVCGGDNSSCIEITGVFNGKEHTPLGTQPRGLMTAVKIPRGVTNAYVKKVSPRKEPFSSDSYDDFTLLIFEELRTQIRRGETYEPFSGAELYYSGSRRPEEVVAISGKVQKDVNIVIRVENQKTTRSLPSIEYRYYVDKSEKDYQLYFEAEEAARQNALRVHDRAQRSNSNDVSSIGSARRRTLGSSRSTQANTPRRPRLHFVWRISELPHGCTTCTGNVTTYAECYPQVDKTSDQSFYPQLDFYRPVANTHCQTMLQPPPVFRHCADYCGVRWSSRPVEGAPECSSRCGEGQRVVVPVCEELVVPAEQKNKSYSIWRLATLGERVCIRAGLGEASQQPKLATCQGECQQVSWALTNWSECTVDCGFGERYRMLRCQQQDGKEWPLKECAASDVRSSAKSFESQTASEILTASAASVNHLENPLERLSVSQTEPCFSLANCKNALQWSTSEWSPCEPVDEKLTSFCRSAGPTETIAAQQLYHRVPHLGVRHRQIYCKMVSVVVPASLRGYMIESPDDVVTATNTKQHWLMKSELCRRAAAVEELSAEPSDKEYCDRPQCFRWGKARISPCSATCGTGQRSARIPCERVTLEFTATESHFIAKTASGTSSGIISASQMNEVEHRECHQHLAYSPRIFLLSDKPFIHVDTVERPLGSQKANRELKMGRLEDEITMECINEPCRIQLPAWHTTSWSQCSVTCGHGIRRRQALCVLETRKQDQQSHVLIASRLSAEVVDARTCVEANLPKPAEEETCLEGPCPQWVAELWGACEGHCEYGVQRRNIRCVLDLSPSPPVPVNSRHDYPGHTSTDLVFSPSSPPSRLVRRHRSMQLIEADPESCRRTAARPSDTRLCLISQGCPYWHKTSWSRCSVDCGMGIRQREITCRYPNGTRLQDDGYHDGNQYRQEGLQYTLPYDRSEGSLITSVAGRNQLPHCLGARPIHETNCKTRPCQGDTTFWWSMLVKERHSETCEVGRCEQVIKCLSARLGQTHDSACRHQTRPEDWTFCVPQTCKQFEWHEEPWSLCPRNCGRRSRYRKVRCVDDLGDEYSDVLCPLHLRPDQWGLCPEFCSGIPSSCVDQKKFYPNSRDGVYQLHIERVVVSVYCADMDTAPKEYVNLVNVNFARSSAFLQPNSQSDFCPGDETSPDQRQKAVKSLDLVETNEAADQNSHRSEVSVANCPECPFVPSVSSATYYQKIRVNLHNLRVDIEDNRFSYTVGASPLYYATAKDCFGSEYCPQGRFKIDLRGTGFRVSPKTRWSITNEPGSSHIYRSHAGQMIVGNCGGNCTGCWPRPGLFLELTERLITFG